MSVLFVVLSVVFFVSGVWLCYAQRSNLTFPTVQSSSTVDDFLFVDSGCYPEGVYIKREAFLQLSSSSTVLRGLHSSNHTDGRGTVCFWLPSFNGIHVLAD